MKVSIVQTMPVFAEIEGNLKNAIGQMGGVNADLFVLPELFNTGYNFIDIGEVERLAEKADGHTFRSIYGFCKRRSCYVVYGFAEKGEKTYNSCALVGPDGMIGLYRKVHLFFREKIFFAPGDLGFNVFDLPIGRIGMMICFDWIYPEAARTLAVKGAQLIAHPSNLVLPYCPDAMVTRCLENKVYAATANRVGSENRGSLSLGFIGKSEIVSPCGEILVRLGEREAEAAVADIDIASADNKEVNEYNDLFLDRRPGMYGVC